MSPAARSLGLALLGLALFPAGAHAAPVDRPRVGLALGGGSAKGMAHVGVLRWLEEHRVPVDMIAGASTGAFIGGAYATGLTAPEIEELLRDLDWDLILSPDIPYPLKSLRRKEDTRDYSIKIEAGLRHGFRFQSGLNPGHFIGLLISRVVFPYSSVENFDDLVIPFRAVASDLQSGEIVVLDRGPLAPALRASMALPGSYDPVRLNGRLLTDGGVLNNVPVDVVRDMGARVVIAVSVDSKDDAPPAETIPGVANRAISLMMRSLEEPRLRGADVVIRPDLDGLTSSDFRESAEIIRRGYQAAEALSGDLLEHALSEEDWAEYQASRRARMHPRHGPVSFVEVEGVTPAAAAQVVQRVEEDLAHAHEPPSIEAHLNWLVGMGRYASATYRRVLRGEAEGLHIDVRDKSYAPPSLKFSIQLDNESKNLNLAVGTRLTLVDVTTPGSEWRFDTSLGSTLGFSTELLQPLRGGGPLRRGAFIAPRAGYVRTSESLYSDGVLTGIYGRQRVSAGLDAGWIIGRKAQLRAGYETAYVRDDTRIGDRTPQTRGAEQSLRLRIERDGQDRAYFPTRGLRFSAQASWVLDAPGASRPFLRAESALGLAGSFKQTHLFTLQLETGLSEGTPPPLLFQFALGGPFRLGALAPRSLRGPRLLLARATYRRPLTRLPLLLGDRLFAMALVETGAVFDRFASARMRTNVGAGLAADTFLGPLFVGVSAGQGGAVRAYFILGGLVR